MSIFNVGDLITYNNSIFCVIKRIEKDEFQTRLWGVWERTREEAIQSLNNYPPDFNSGYIDSNSAKVITPKKKKIEPYGISKFIDKLNQKNY
jgi:signal peptidase I